MGDFLKTVFGGSTTEQQSTSTPTDLTPDPYKALRQPFADALTKLLQGGGGPEYSGPLYSPITGAETSALGSIEGQTGTGTQRAGVISDTLAGKYLPGQEGANPFLDAAIKAAQRPTLQGLEETLGRTLPGRFTQAGHLVQSNEGGNGGSSAFDRAASIATRGAADAIGDIATKISAGAYETERGRQQEAVTLSRAEVDTSIQNLQAQALPRLIQELGIERGLALFQSKTQNLLDILKTIGGVAAPVVANTAQSTGDASAEKGIVPGLFGSKGPFGI